LTAQSDGSNRGSAFTLSMQALPQGEAATVDSKTITDSARQALKILLVDDHHDTCAALEKLLARCGPLVAVTHDVRSAMEADIERSLQAGFSEHLIKPIKLDNLEAAIERALSAT
jgi:CheY-like chemotaxis protein